MKRILIAEISDNISWGDYFPLFSNTWAVNLNNDYSLYADPDFELENIGLEDSRSVISFEVDNISYTEVSALSDIINPPTIDAGYWFYDVSTRYLYIYFEYGRSPYYWEKDLINIGFKIGLYYSNSDFDGVIDGEQYLPRLLSSPEISEKKDDIFYGKKKYRSSKISFDNSDMRYKNFNFGKNKKPRIGSVVKTAIWYGEDYSAISRTDFYDNYIGVIEKITESNIIELSLIDLRKNLTKKNELRILNNANFPYLDDSDEVIYIPQVWGYCKEILCKCLNETEADSLIGTTPTSFSQFPEYEFLVSDSRVGDIPNVTGTRLRGSDYSSITSSIVISNDLSNGIYTLKVSSFYFAKWDSTTGNVIGGFYDIDKIFFDIEGYGQSTSPTLYNNSLDIIEKLILKIYNRPYSSVFYNTTEWSSAKSSAFDIGLYIEKPTELYKTIEEIAKTNLSSFVIDYDLKYSWRKYAAYTPTITITKDEFIGQNYIHSFTMDVSKTLESFRVGYNKKNNSSSSSNENKYNWYQDSTNSVDAYSKYKFPTKKDFETLITGTSYNVVSSFRQLIHNEFDNSFDTFEVIVDFQYYELQVGDYIYVEADMPNYEWLGTVLCEIISIKQNINNWTLTIGVRIKEYI